MSKFDQIIAFISIIEESSFAGAARKLGISTAAVSRQIANLEAELKTVLLHRTTRQVTPTEIGVEYYQRCKTILQNLKEAEANIAHSQTEAIGKLRITCSRYFALEFIIPHLPAFIAHNPKIEIHLELAERFPNLVEEEIDILFGVQLIDAPDLVHKRIATTRYLLCVSPTYLKRHGMPKMPADLTQHHFITHSQRVPDNVIKLKDNKEVIIQPTIWLNDTQAMLECAKLDLGLVLLHEYVVADAIQKGALIEVLKDYQQAPQTIYLYYQQSRYLQPKIRRFVDFFSNIKMKA